MRRPAPLERRILTAPNRAHPVGKIGALLIVSLSMKPGLHALKPGNLCPGKQRQLRSVGCACQADPSLQPSFGAAADQERQDDCRMMLQKSARLKVGSL